MKRYVWYSDTHLNKSVFPFMKRGFIRRLDEAHADGVIVTGDISSGLRLESDLRFLARHFDGPIYFVLGNHDYHKRHIESVHADVRRLCARHPNLCWLTDIGLVELTDNIALVGTEGWYDASLGDPTWLRWTTDWWLTLDFLQMDSMDERIAAWRRMARTSAELVESRLQQAFERYRTVYVATHFPPWREATRSAGTFMESFWLPYNTNAAMGAAIERVAIDHPDSNVVVLAGHTHVPCHVRVSDNVQCHVARATYRGQVNAEETLVL